MNLGVRELRDGLSRHLALVRRGAEITVTDHGKPIARLMPLDAVSGLERLIAPTLFRGLRSRAAARGVSPEVMLSEVIELGLEHCGEAAPRTRNGFPVLSGPAGHAVTDELVAAYRDDQ